MRHVYRLTLLGCAAFFGSYVYGQTNNSSANPFNAVSERGETVHILPGPAMVRLAGDTDPVIAAPSNETKVYRGSFGLGKLIDHRGPEVAQAGFQAIYWNTSVSGSTATSLGYGNIQSQMDAFITLFADGKNWDNSLTDDYTIIQQYGSHAIISNTLIQNPDFVDTQATAPTISDTAIQTYLASLFTAGTLTPSASTIYGVYFPSGMQVTLGTSSSCSSFCGYHSHFTYSGTTVKYAVFPYPDCVGCTVTGLTVADVLTIVSSHEIRETVTDPLGNAWHDFFGFEADDKCAWHHLYQMTNGSFWVQPEYSNGGISSNSGFTATYPGPGCVVPNK